MQKNGHLNLSIWILFEGSFAVTVSAGVGEDDGQADGVSFCIVKIISLCFSVPDLSKLLVLTEGTLKMLIDGLVVAMLNVYKTEYWIFVGNSCSILRTCSSVKTLLNV